MRKRVLIWFLTVISIIAIGMFLVSASYLIDTSNLEKHLLESKETLAKESSHYMLGEKITSVLDNETDSMMLLIASYRGNENILNKTMNNYYVLNGENSPYDQVATCNTENPPVKDSYYRYWHGYLIFLRPLLAFFNYGQIRIINTVIHIILLSALVYLLWKKKASILILPILSAFLIMNPMATFLSLQNSTIWYVTCISMIVYLLLNEKIIKHHLHFLLFTIVGMITSFMDFLTYPITTLGLLLILVLVSEKLSFKEQVKRILACGISWTLGYGIMWTAKWVLATLILKENVIANALKAITFRSSNLTAFDDHFSRLILLRDMLLLFKSKLNYFIIFVNGIIGLSILIYRLKKYGLSMYGIIKENGKYNFKTFWKNILNSLPVLSISLVTMVWYFVLANHTQIHPFLSCRTAYSFFVAILTWGYYLVTIKNLNNNKGVFV